MSPRLPLPIVLHLPDLLSSVPTAMRLLLGIAALFTACVFSAAATETDGIDPADRQAVGMALAAMCDKSVVILGEASHGDGHSDAVKTAMVTHLVEKCGFKGVLFESSFYEFFPISRSVRAKTPVAPTLIAAAVGGYWKFDREVQPLFDFLATQASAGKVALGGLDFQAGGFEQPYSNEVMIKELAARMPQERRELCTALYRSRIDGNDPPNGMSKVARAQSLKLCLVEMRSSIVGQENLASGNHERLLQLKNLDAWVVLDGQPFPELVRERDRLMADNVRSFIEQLPKPAKVVIWAHNGHAARETSALGDYGNSQNLGTALSQHFGDKLFSMATTACGGEYRWTPGTNKPIPTAPVNSLEAQVCSDKDPVSTFIDASQLKQLGVRDSAVFGHSYSRAKWADTFDGILVLDKEYAPHNTRF
jgi:erythromycin esterase-like protein